MIEYDTVGQHDCGSSLIISKKAFQSTIGRKAQADDVRRSHGKPCRQDKRGKQYREQQPRPRQHGHTYARKYMKENEEDDKNARAAQFDMNRKLHRSAKRA